MSATQHAALDAGVVAHVSFKVRCEALSHGEEVFLVHQGDHGVSMNIPLFTSASQYPWYHTTSPLTLTLPNHVLDHQNTQKAFFSYKYAIHRAGVFHRYEQPGDGPQRTDAFRQHPEEGRLDVATDDIQPDDLHQVPLHLLQNHETYVCNDVLGVTNAPPQIDHIRVKTRPTYTRASTLHARTSSHNQESMQSLAKKANAKPGTPAGTGRKKAVGFAPTPPSYHGSEGTTKHKQAVHLNSTDGVVVVSAFLPVILHRNEDTGHWTADWDYEMLLSMQTHLRVTRVGVVKWRGWHGNTGQEGSPHAGVPISERTAVEECLRPLNCVPVWIEPTLFGEMYNGFCKGVLWPVLHNVTSVYSDRPDDNQTFGRRPSAAGHDNQFSEISMDDFEQGPIHGGRGREADLWSAYNNVNRQFAEVVVQCFNEGDLVWINGFHLLILPSYLTRRVPMAKVGIFLHTPFPSSEIFRTLWCREDLLRGMLNADQVGFHLFEYARHFLTSCRRLLGLNYGMIPDASGGHTLAVDTNGRNVVVTSIHAGIEPPVLKQVLDHPSTMDKVTSTRNRFPGKTLICGIDRMESLKGIPFKLLALERFLKRCPEFVGKVCLVQIGISAFERGDDYQRTKLECEKLVTRINTTWPGSVEFEELPENQVRLQHRMALLRAADIVLITSIRDGLNLLPLEFTIAHQDALNPSGQSDGRKRGLCILSEFSSCTRVMRGALHINPWKISEIANAFHIAIKMSDEERLRRLSIASEFVTRVTTQRWALAVMLDLKGVYKNVSPSQFSGAGLGLGYRLLGMDTGFLSLDLSKVAKAYRNSRARLILVDYGGTIVSNDNLDKFTRFQMVKERSAPSEPTESMIDTLKKLCEDKRNTVFVVSGKERHSLTKTLGNIPSIGLAAEHGMFISWPTKRTTGKRRWETLVPETDRTWRSLAITIMEVYASRTHGSYIEETEMKVLWQYRDADTEFGFLQAKELEDHLSKYLRSFPVDILHGGIEEGGYVEVRPKGVNKGVLAMRVIKKFPDIAQKEKIDFALVLGDDHCDEPMLSVMRQVGRRVIDSRRAASGEDPLPTLPTTIQLVDVSGCDPFLASNMETFTSTVGKKPTAAATYLRDVDEVQELLDGLVKVSTRDQKYFSSVDLQSFAKQLSTSPEVSVGGFMRSMSMERMVDGDSSIQNMRSTSLTVSTNLNDFLGTIADEEEDEANFF